MHPGKHESAIRVVALFGCRNLVNLLRIAKHWSNGHRTPSTLLCWSFVDVLPLVMLFSLKSPVSDASESSPALDSIQTELDRWKNLIFSFDMDEENSSSSSNPPSSNPQRSRSPAGASGSRDNNTRVRNTAYSLIATMLKISYPRTFTMQCSLLSLLPLLTPSKLMGH